MACLKMIVVRQNGEARKVPCGKCGFCLQQKRSQWMFRIWHEMRTQECPGWFLTLTYNEKFVKRTGDGRLSLRFRDVQLYLKRLRRAGYYCKYVCVGEYGSATDRPHYHMLLWTDAPSSVLSSSWCVVHDDGSRSELGHVHFGTLTMESAMYCMKYIIQPKVNEEQTHSMESRREKTRAQFSRGIGLAYLSMAVYDWHTRDYDDPRFHSVVDGRKVALPRYYCQKIFTKHQRGRESERLKWQQVREFRQEMREHIAHFKRRGQVAPPFKSYYDGLRRLRARQIIETSKFSEKL